MKERLQKLFAGRTARILLAAAAAALLLLLCFAVFGGTQGAAETGGYAETAEEVRLSALLSRIEGAGQVDAAITEEDGVPVRAVVFFTGEDGILLRLRLTQAAAAALNIAENRVFVCPAET